MTEGPSSRQEALPRMDAPRVRPVIALPRAGIPTPLLVLLMAILAVGLFLFLESRRSGTDEQNNVAQRAFRPGPSPPPLTVPRAGRPFVEEPVLEEEVYQDPPEPVVILPPVAPPPVPAPVVVAPQPVPAAQLSTGPVSSGLVVDFTRGPGVVQDGATGQGEAAGSVPYDDAVRATLIRNRQSLIPQGTIISAVLETPLNSDRPGPVRALVSRDARSFDGSRVLIPRGSRLIGEFQADTNPNQRRVLVTWTRLIRPDGVAIRIGSPAADALGGIGVAGRVNTHFFSRFASAVLQSALTVGVNVASASAVDPGSIYVGIPGQVGEIGKELVPDGRQQPTVQVKEGAEIGIFVARDLDFGGTPPVR